MLSAPEKSKHDVIDRDDPAQYRARAAGFLLRPTNVGQQHNGSKLMYRTGADPRTPNLRRNTLPSHLDPQKLRSCTETALIHFRSVPQSRRCPALDGTTVLTSTGEHPPSSWTCYFKIFLRNIRHCNLATEAFKAPDTPLFLLLSKRGFMSHPHPLIYYRSGSAFSDRSESSIRHVAVIK